MSKKFKLILTSSLVLNILLVGLILGFGFGRMKHRPMMKPEMNQNNFAQKEEMMVMVLPPEKQQEARNLFKKLREIRERNFTKDSTIFFDLENVVKAQNFDEQKFLQTIASTSAAMENTKKESDVVIAKFLSTLNQEERTILLGKFKEMHKKHFENNARPNGEMPKMPPMDPSQNQDRPMISQEMKDNQFDAPKMPMAQPQK